MTEHAKPTILIDPYDVMAATADSGWSLAADGLPGLSMKFHDNRLIRFAIANWEVISLQGRPAMKPVEMTFFKVMTEGLNLPEPGDDRIQYGKLVLAAVKSLLKVDEITVKNGTPAEMHRVFEAIAAHWRIPISLRCGTPDRKCDISSSLGLGRMARHASLWFAPEGTQPNFIDDRMHILKGERHPITIKYGLANQPPLTSHGRMEILEVMEGFYDEAAIDLGIGGKEVASILASISGR